MNRLQTLFCRTDISAGVLFMKIRHELTPYFCETYMIDRHKDYPVEWIDSRTLLVSERLDLAAKVKYIESRESGQISPFVRDCYVKHIEAFSYGTFKESGTNEKDSIKKYIYKLS